MIKLQPESIHYAIKNCTKQASSIAKLLKNKRSYLTGCGSSFHAAIYGEYVLRASGFDAHAIHALDMIHYTPNLRNSVVIVVSHSWKTRTTLKALEVLKKKKASCVGITANQDVKDLDIVMRVSKEFDESDCVTMGYTTKLVALALIARTKNAGLQRIPKLISNVLENEKQIKELVDVHSTKKRFFVLGAGPNTATAYEVALKMKEGNFTDTEGMQLEQMLHGSISGIDAEDTVFLIAPKDGAAYKRISDAAHALSKIGVSTIAITDRDGGVSRVCKHTVKVPYCIELLNPVISIIPLQLFAYYLAKTNGINPDLTREDDFRYKNAYAKLHLHIR
ncbi:MAG: SIS domain-containing protein [Nitrososphaerales archaeon]